MHIGLHVKRPLLFSDLKQNFNVSIHFSKSGQCQMLRKSVSLLSSCFMRTDGRTAIFAAEGDLTRKNVRINKFHVVDT
jgi:hypothetical protein